MMAILDWLYGPQRESDPYYLLLHDFVILMPWWYPLFWIALIGGFFSWRVVRYLRARSRATKAVRRVKARTERVFGRQQCEIARLQHRRRPANDLGGPGRDGSIVFG